MTMPCAWYTSSRGASTSFDVGFDLPGGSRPPGRPRACPWRCRRTPARTSTAPAGIGAEPVLVDVQDPHADRADLQREREHAAGPGLVGRWGVRRASGRSRHRRGPPPGPAAARRMASTQGPSPRSNCRPSSSPGVRVGTGDGAADLPLLDQADPGPRRRQRVRHRRTQPSQQTRGPRTVVPHRRLEPDEGGQAPALLLSLTHAVPRTRNGGPSGSKANTRKATVKRSLAACGGCTIWGTHHRPARGAEVTGLDLG